MLSSLTVRRANKTTCFSLWCAQLSCCSKNYTTAHDKLIPMTFQRNLMYLLEYIYHQCIVPVAYLRPVAAWYSLVRQERRKFGERSEPENFCGATPINNCHEFVTSKKKKKKQLPNVGFEPESHRCKTNTLTTRPPKLMFICSTKI